MFWPAQEWTADGEEFTDVHRRQQTRFFNYQRTVNARTAQVPSHAARGLSGEYGRDYRYEDAPHPVKALQDREKDNNVGRTCSRTK